MPAERIEKYNDKKIAHFRLADFLRPNGIYPYETLAQEMEEMRADGHIVYVWSVPGFMMVSGHPDRENLVQEYPWRSNGMHYRTAANCLAIKGGISEGELFPDD